MNRPRMPLNLFSQKSRRARFLLFVADFIGELHYFPPNILAAAFLYLERLAIEPKYYVPEMVRDLIYLAIQMYEERNRQNFWKVLLHPNMTNVTALWKSMGCNSLIEDKEYSLETTFINVLVYGVEQTRRWNKNMK